MQREGEEKKSRLGYNTNSDHIYIIINGKVIIDAKQGKGAQTVGLKLATYKARKRGCTCRRCGLGGLSGML